MKKLSTCWKRREVVRRKVRREYELDEERRELFCLFICFTIAEKRSWL